MYINFIPPNSIWLAISLSGNNSNKNVYQQLYHCNLRKQYLETILLHCLSSFRSEKLKEWYFAYENYWNYSKIIAEL